MTKNELKALLTYMLYQSDEPLVDGLVVRVRRTEEVTHEDIHRALQAEDVRGAAGISGVARRGW